MFNSKFRGRDFISILDFKKNEVEAMLDLADELKRKFKRGQPHKYLEDRTLFMLFYNQSLRTRNSFEAGMTQLGGHAHFLDPDKIYMPALEGEEVAYSTERISDVARVLDRMGHGIAIRMYGDPVGWQNGKANRIVREFADWAEHVPVINMEDDLYHPCQGMADIMTVREHFGRFNGVKFVMSWAYSPSVHKPLSVPHSAIIAAATVGCDVVLAHPEGLELEDRILKATEKRAKESGGSFEITNDMDEAFDGAHVVYPKAWTSKHFIPPIADEPMLEKTEELFAANKHWMCDEEKMKLGADNVKYMHCLPCDRGYEVTDDVIDGPRSIVFDQAENRLHAQKAIMSLLMD
ncbi:MAG: N-acetylornithine carbamoyltransferase [Candidatus Eisenbacteria bacterium]|nr:N-acetylornithine carbamoyltransferase [Candidatus Eisenbacteria bacterium]